MNDAVKVLVISMRSEYRRVYEGLVEDVGVNFDSVDSLRAALSNVTSLQRNHHRLADPDQDG